MRPRGSRHRSEASGNVKFISWNVNGIRAVLKKGFLEFVEEHDPDILCVQETKAHPEQVGLEMPRYRDYWNAAVKKGYSGTAIFTKVEPRAVTLGIGRPEHDQEGRVLTAEFDDYYLVNVYTPNAQEALARLDYRVGQWDVAFLEHLKRLESSKPVIFCGDLNVAHQEIDIARPKENRRNPGFTDEERESFGRILGSGFVDTFREFTSEGGHYSWWSYRAGARARNVGWRIDYFCVSGGLRSRLKDASILPHVTGSDHCPVVMELD
jgi:exodeoxyribonuclease III